MLVKKTKFKDLYLIKKKKFKDNRGYFCRDFCKKELKSLNFDIKQTNISFNVKKHTLRGFHYQIKPNQEKKIITCMQGSILNISIDLRKKSKTYLKFFKTILNENNGESIHVPEGFANAYLTLKENTKILYYMSEFYKPFKARSIRYDDKFFAIKWPYKPKVISKRDLNIKDFKLNE
jgi:dTDP-4-dehydrorhamnose 3,5-epimerase